MPSEPSRVRINIRKKLLYLRALDLGLLSVDLRPLKPLCAQAFVHLRFLAVASAYRAPEETASVAVVEGFHDFFAG